MNATLISLLFLAPCDCFLDFAWRWTEQTTPVDVRGQMIWFGGCMSGPVYYPSFGGCMGRFDMWIPNHTHGDGHIDLRDYAGLQHRSTARLERATVSSLADLNGDNRIDMRDVAIFQNVFGNPSTPEPPRAVGDIDGRNGVDLNDWMYFLLSWRQ